MDQNTPEEQPVGGSQPSFPSEPETVRLDLPLNPPGAPASPAGMRRLGGMRRGVVIAIGALVLLLLVGGGIVLAMAHPAATAPGAAPVAAASATQPPAKAHQAAVIYTVTTITGMTLTATQPQGGTVTITLTAKTAFVRAGQPATLANIAVGTKVRVAGKQGADGGIEAKKVEILLPTISGTVTTVSGNTITVKDHTAAHAVLVGTTTTFENAQTHTPAALGDIQPGMEIRAEGTLNADGSMSALRIMIGVAKKGDTGTGTPAPMATPAE